MIIKDFGAISVLEFGAKGDGVADDSIAIQKAIDYAAIKGRKVIFPEGEYIISKTIIIKEDVELNLHRNTIISIVANVKGFELQSGAAIGGGTIIIKAQEYTSDAIYLDGKYQYDNNTNKVFVRDINIWGNGKTSGTAISLFSGGDWHHIHYINMERVSIWGLDVGIKLKATDPGSGMAWVNANKFDMFTISECRTMIEIDSMEYPPYECTGNFFTNLQIQPGENTEKIFVISGSVNTFTGMVWDLHMVEHDDEAIIFTEGSSGNHVDIRYFPDDRVLDLGHSGNIVGPEGLISLGAIDSNINWNALTKMGTYRIAIPNGMNETLNHPSNDAYEYGILIVTASESNTAQMYIPHENDGIYMRSKFGFTDWTGWSNIGGGGISGSGFDERQTLYDEKIDWNSLIRMGSYRIMLDDDTFTEEMHHPVGAYNYGLLLVFLNDEQTTQMYISHHNDIYSRSCYEHTFEDSWSDWIKLITSEDVEHLSKAMLPKYHTEDNEDWNNLVAMGTYFISQEDNSFTAANNQPVDAYTYGLLTVFNSGHTVSQMYMTHMDSRVHFRSAYFGSEEPWDFEGDWSDWRIFISDEDIEHLEEALLPREERSTGDINTDWNTFIRMGTYQIVHEDETFIPALNQPPTSVYAHGLLQVLSNDFSVTQIYFPHLTSEVWIRTDYNVSIERWTPWRLLGGGGGNTGPALIESLVADPIAPEVGRIWLRSDL